jgi:hypothetical protein
MRISGIDYFIVEDIKISRISIYGIGCWKETSKVTTDIVTGNVIFCKKKNKKKTPGVPTQEQLRPLLFISVKHGLARAISSKPNTAGF